MSNQIVIKTKAKCEKIFKICSNEERCKDSEGAMSRGGAPVIVSMPQIHEDARRAIFEIGYIFGISVRKTLLAIRGPAELGNHYHRECTETFFLLEGRGRLITREIGQSGIVISEENKIYELKAPSLIIIKPFIAHRFSFNAPATLTCDANKPFDPKDIIPFIL